MQATEVKEQVHTPKGIMYLMDKDEIFVYCYDDETGKEEKFLIEEVSYYHALFPTHQWKIK